MLQEYYRIDVQSLDLIPTLMDSDSYLLRTSDGKSFFLKMLPAYNLDALLIKYRFCQFLVKHNLPALLPLKNPLQEYFTVYDGKALELYPYIATGKCEPSEIGSHDLAELGEALGLIHRVSAQYKTKSVFSSNKNIQLTVKNNKQLLPKFLNKAGDLISGAANDFIDLKITLAKDFPDSFTISSGISLITHGDFHCGNIFLRENGQVKNIVDFDKCKMGVPEIELVRSILYICVSSLGSQTVMQRISSFVYGYSLQYDIDKQLMQKVLKFSYMKLVMSTWLLDLINGSNVNMNELKSLIKSQLTILKFLSHEENYEKLSMILSN